MELLNKLILMLLLIELEYDSVCYSKPLHGGQQRLILEFTTPPEVILDFRASYFRIIVILCLAWVTLAAIGWGCYYGCRERENSESEMESQASSPYECVCCGKIPPEKCETIKTEQTVQRKGQCCGSGEDGSYEKSHEMRQGKKPTSTSCCGPQNESFETNVRKSEVRTKKSRPCCGGQSQSEETTLVVHETRPRSSNVEKKSPLCCTGGGYSVTERSIPKCKKCNKMEAGHADNAMGKQSGQNTLQFKEPCSKTNQSKGVCPCCHKNSDDFSDISDRPSTMSQFSQRILQEDIRTVGKAAPNKGQFDFNHVKNASPSRMVNSGMEVKPENVQMEGAHLSGKPKVMRPTPTSPEQSLIKERSEITRLKPSITKEMSNISKRNDAFVQANIIDSKDANFKQAPPHYILVQSTIRNSQPCPEYRSDRYGGLCCSAVCKDKPVTGNIHPIISGYQVKGHLKVKGKDNRDSFTIPEDSYKVMPR